MTTTGNNGPVVALVIDHVHAMIADHDEVDLVASPTPRHDQRVADYDPVVRKSGAKGLAVTFVRLHWHAAEAG